MRHLYKSWNYEWEGLWVVEQQAITNGVYEVVVRGCGAVRTVAQFTLSSITHLCYLKASVTLQLVTTLWLKAGDLATKAKIKLKKQWLAIDWRPVTSTENGWQLFLSQGGFWCSICNFTTTMVADWLATTLRSPLFDGHNWSQFTSIVCLRVRG